MVAWHESEKRRLPGPLFCPRRGHVSSVPLSASPYPLPSLYPSLIWRLFFTRDWLRQLWLTLAERHLEQRSVDWKQAEKLCFNEWSNPDDEELGIQIVKVRRRCARDPRVTSRSRARRNEDTCDCLISAFLFLSYSNLFLAYLFFVDVARLILGMRNFFWNCVMDSYSRRWI